MSELAGGQAPTLKALIFSLSIGVARLCVPRHGTVLTQTWQINRHANERVHALAFVLPSLSFSLSLLSQLDTNKRANVSLPPSISPQPSSSRAPFIPYTFAIPSTSLIALYIHPSPSTANELALVPPP